HLFRAYLGKYQVRVAPVAEVSECERMDVSQQRVPGCLGRLQSLLRQISDPFPIDLDVLRDIPRPADLPVIVHVQGDLRQGGRDGDAGGRDQFHVGVALLKNEIVLFVAARSVGEHLSSHEYKALLISELIPESLGLSLQVVDSYRRGENSGAYFL